MNDKTKPARAPVTPPNAGKGRPPGPNKVTTALKEAILLAAKNKGSDGKGAGGLVGYLEMLAGKERKAFAMLLGKVLPLKISGEGEDGAIRVVIKDYTGRKKADAAD
jgi:hypothetical protein